jgi:hypothetical protein
VPALPNYGPCQLCADAPATAAAAAAAVLQEMGLAFDEWDLDYYTKLFT